MPKMRDALVMLAIVGLLIAGFAVQRARDHAHQQPLGTETMKSLGH